MIGITQLAAAARQEVPELTAEQALAIAAAQHKMLAKDESHEMRKSRHLLKGTRRELGRAGHTIHHLRGEIALLRAQKAAMVHQGIDALIKDAVINAVPITIGDDGQLEGIGGAELGETLLVGGTAVDTGV